jgi:ABC-type transporter Mla subunit MlaD
MAENRTFTLIGKFDDQITKKLKSINDALSSLGKTVNRDLSGGFKALNKELKTLSNEFKDLGKSLNDKKGVTGLKDSLRAANSEAKVLGTNLRNAMEAGASEGGRVKDGIVAAQGEAKVLGDILKANA